MFQTKSAFHDSHVTPVTIYAKQPETSHISQLVNRPFKICDTDMSNKVCMTTIEFPKSSLKKSIPASITLKPE